MKKKRNHNCGSTLPGISELHRLAPTALAAALFALAAGSAHAGPAGGVVVGGSGNIHQPDSNTTNVHQHSNRMAVQWDSFNLAPGQTVNFHQPSSSAFVLNQILDANASVIRGQINANGNVVLVNSAGIYFSETAQLNVGSLIASGHSLSVDDFMAGYLRFQREAGKEGRVVNHGTINAATGGSVTLLGSSVENTGDIYAKAGRVNLAVGERITLDFDGDGLMRFAVDEALLENIDGLDSAIHNTGNISADGGSVIIDGRVAQDVFSRVVNNEGIIQAGRIENTGGEIRLVGSGGSGSSVVNTGQISASALDDQSSGGQITLHAEDDTLLVSGESRIDASSSNQQGGQIHLLGNQIGLSGTTQVDASGATGGGEILIGGDYQGLNTDIPNADKVVVTSGVTLNADATHNGDGGRIITWADNWTRFAGSLSARGGDNGGNGGFAEVSGKQNLLFEGRADLRSSTGITGTLLLDPENIIITQNTDTDGITFPVNFADGVGADYSIRASTINSLGLTTHVILEANNNISQAGTNANFLIEIASNHGITLRAGNSISIGRGIITQGGNITLEAHSVDAIGGAKGDGIISISGALSSNGGNISLSGNSIQAGATINAGTAGSLRLIANDTITGTGALTGGNILLETSTGNIGADAANRITANTNSLTAIAGGSAWITNTGTDAATLAGTAGSVFDVSHSGSDLNIDSGTNAAGENVDGINAGSVKVAVTGANNLTVDQVITSSSGALELNSEQDLNINKALQAAGNLNLSATGDITTTTDGTISSTAPGNIILSGANLTLASSLSTTDGNISLTGTGALNLNDGSIRAVGADGSVSLITLNAASINQHADHDGLIADQLKVLTSAGNATLSNTANTVGTLAASITGGDLTFTNSTSLALGNVEATDGITAAAFSLTLGSGDLNISQAVTVDSLIWDISGGVTLSNALTVATFAGENINIATGGNFVTNHASSIITSNGGDISLKASSFDLQLGEINTGTGGLRMEAISNTDGGNAINQNTSHRINASALLLLLSGSGNSRNINLGGTTNTIGRVAGRHEDTATHSIGNFTLNNNASLIIDTLDAGGTLGNINGLTAESITISVTSESHYLNVDQALNASTGDLKLSTGANGNIFGAELLTGNNVIVEAGAGIGTDDTNRLTVNATNLTLIAGSDVWADSQDSATTLAGSAAGVFDLTHTGGALTIDTTKNLADADVVGVSGDSITLVVTGDSNHLNVDQALNANAADLKLSTDTNGDITGVGTLNATNIHLNSGSSITLSGLLAASNDLIAEAGSGIGTDGANRLTVNTSNLTLVSGGAVWAASQGSPTTLAGSAIGAFDLTQTGGALTIGTTKNLAGTDILSLSGNGITLAVTGDGHHLNVSQALNASAGDLKLSTDTNGNVTGAGLLTGGSVIVEAGAGIGTDDVNRLTVNATNLTLIAGNGAVWAASQDSATTLAGSAIGAFDLTHTGGDLTLGTTNRLDAPTISGLTAAGVTLAVSGDGSHLSVNQALNAGTADLKLSTSTNGNIAGAGLLTGNNVIVEAGVGIGTDDANRLTVNATNLTLIAGSGAVWAASQGSATTLAGSAIGAFDLTHTGGALAIGTTKNLADVDVVGVSGLGITLAVSGDGNHLNVNQALNANAGDLKLSTDTNGNITGAGTLNAANIHLSIGSSITLLGVLTATDAIIAEAGASIGTDDANRLTVNATNLYVSAGDNAWIDSTSASTTLAGNITNTLDLLHQGDLSVGTVNSVAGLTVNSATLNIQTGTANGHLNINENLTAAASLTVNAAGTLATAADKTLSLTGSGTLAITAASLVNSGTIQANADNALINITAPSVTLNTGSSLSASGTDGQITFNLGAASATLGGADVGHYLTSDELALITADRVNFSTDKAAGNNLTIENFTASGFNQLNLEAYDVIGAGAITDLGQLTVNAANLINLTGANDIASVNLVNTGTTTDSTITYTSAATSLNITASTASTDVADGTNAILIDAKSGALIVGDTGITAASGNIELRSDLQITTTVAGTVNAGTKRVILATSDVTKAIHLGGTATAGRLDIADDLTAKITAGTLQIGRSTMSGIIQVDGAFSRTGNLILNAGTGSILNAAGTDRLIADGSLTLNAATIGSGAESLRIKATSLSGTATGSMYINHAGNLTLGGGGASLTAGADQTLSITTVAEGGDVGNLILGSAISVTGTSGTLILNAAGSITSTTDDDIASANAVQLTAGTDLGTSTQRLMVKANQLNLSGTDGQSAWLDTERLSGTDPVTLTANMNGSNLDLLHQGSDLQVNTLANAATLNLENNNNLLLTTNITTTGSQTYTGAVILAADNLTLTAKNTDPTLQTITFKNTLQSAASETYALTLDAHASFEAAVNDLGSLEIKGNLTTSTSILALGSLDVTGNSSLAGNIATTGSQTYQGTVTLTADNLTLTAKNNDADPVLQDITFNQALASEGANQFNLTLDADVAFNSTVSDLGNLVIKGDLNTNAAALTLGSIDVTGNSSLAGNITTTDTQAFSGTMVLSGTNGTIHELKGSSVNLSGAVDATTSGEQSLKVTGNAVFGSALGATTKLGTLEVTGTTSLAGDVSTTGNQDYNGAVTLSGGGSTTHILAANQVSLGAVSTTNSESLQITGNAVFNGNITGLTDLSVSGTTALHAASVTTTGSQTYSDTLTLHAADDTTLTAGNNQNLSFAAINTVDTTTTRNLILATGDAGNSGTWGDITLGGELDGLTDLTISHANNINFNGTGTTELAGSLTQNSGTGTTHFKGDITASIISLQAATVKLADSKTLSVTDGNNIEVFADNLTFGAGSTLSAGNGQVTLAPLTTTNSLEVCSGLSCTETFDSTYDLGTLAVTAGSIQLGRLTHEGGITLKELTTTFDMVLENAASHQISVVGNYSGKDLTLKSNGGNINLGADINVAGHDLQFDGAVTLTGGSVVHNLSATSVTFNNTVNATTEGQQNLLVTGNSVFGSALGATTKLGALEVTGTTNLGGNVTTTGIQTYTGQVTLTGTGDTRTLTANTDQLITMTGGLLGAGKNLNITNANWSLGADASGLGTLNIAGTSLLGGDVSTTGIQTYTGQVTLTGTGDTRTLTANTDQLITMTGGLLGAGKNLNITNANWSLGADASGLGTLNIAGTSLLGGDVSTTSNQSYSGAVTLTGGASTTHTLTSGTQVSLGAVSTTNSESLQITGNAVFNGNITSLTNLLVSGTTALHAASVTTSGYQTFSDTLTLHAEGDTTLTTGDHQALRFAAINTADATTRNLILATGTAGDLNSATWGDITLGGMLEGLTNLTISRAANVNLQQDITASGAFEITNATGITTLSNNLQLNAGSIWIKTGVLTFNDSVTLNTSGNNGNISLFTDNFTAGSNLNVNAGDGVAALAAQDRNKTILICTINCDPAGIVGGVATYTLNDTINVTASQVHIGSQVIGEKHEGDIILRGLTLPFDLEVTTTNNKNITIEEDYNSSFTTPFVGGGLLKLDTDGQIHLKGNVTTYKNLTLAGTVILDGHRTLTSTTGNINLTNTVNGGTDKNLSLVAEQGTVTASGNLEAHQIQLSAKEAELGTSVSVTSHATGDAIIALADKLTIGTGGSLVANNNGSVRLAPLTESNNLLICNTGCSTSADFESVYNLSGLTITAGEVTFGGSTHTGNIQTNALDTNYGLKLLNSGAGKIRFNGAYTSTGTNSSLNVTSGSGGIELAGNINTAGNQTYQSAVTLDGGDHTLTSNGHDITFANNITGNANSLTLVAGAGNISLQTVSMNNLTVTSAGNTTFNNILSLTGNFLQSSGSGNTHFKENASAVSFEINAHTITLDSGKELSTNTNGDIQLVTDNLAISGLLDAGTRGITLAPLVESRELFVCSGTCTTDASYDSGNANHALYNIGGDFSYNAGSFGIGTAAHTGDITLYQFTSSFDLELVTTGTINISGAFGSDNSLTLQGDSGINISHNITTKGDQFYKGSVALMNDVSLTSNNGKIQFDATINSDATARALTLSTANGTEFLQAVGGAQQLSQLTVSNGTATLGADISTTGNQSYAGQVILSGGTHTVTSSDAITMGAGLNGEGQGLIIAGNFNFSGTASNLASLTVNGTSTLNGAITTFSTQSYTGAMTLAGNTQLSTDNSGITLGSTVTGLHTLSLNTGTTAFSLNHDVISTAGFNVTSSNITLGADVTTTGNQTYTGAVTLADHRTLTAGAGSLITMTGNLIGGNNSLTIADANWSLAGGNASSLSALSVGGTSLLAGDITTTGSQTYSNGVTLEGVRTLSGSTLTFDSTVTGNDQNLTLTSTTGDTTFKGAVSQFATMLINGTLNLQNTGFIQNVASFSVSGSSVLAGNVTTSGSQSYAGAVTLSGSRALSGSTLTFDNTVTGNNQNLALTGNTTFNGDVSELAAVTINGSLDLLNSSTIQNTASLSVSGATNLTGTVNTANNQTYNGLLTLNGVNTLTSTAGSIGMNNGLNAGNTNFTLAGDWIFSGSTSNLSSLTVSRTSQINGAITTTAGSQAYQGAVTLTGTTNLSAVGQSITFSSSVNGAQQLTTTAATTTFNGFVGNSVRLSNLTVNGATQVNGGGIHTSGNQSYLGGFNANSNTNLNSASGNINLDQAAAANNNLEVRGYNLQFKNITTGGTLTLSAGNQLLYSAGTNLSSSGAMTLAVNQSGNTAGVTLDLNGLNLAASSILLQGSGYDRLQGLTNSGNTWQVTGNGSGTLSNAAFNAGGGNTATFSDFAHLYGGESADTFNISGVHNGNIYAGGGNDIIRLQGNGRVNGQVDGGTGTNTYDISATSSPMTLIWGSGFTGIQSLIGSGDTLQGGASGDTEWALLSATGGNINTASFTGFSTLISGSGGDNNFTSNGQYSGTLQLQGQRNYWNYSQGSTLTRGSVLGNGSLTVDTPAGGVAGNMNIGNGDLLLPNLLNHTGTLFIGSRITPAQLPLGGSSNATINTSSLTVSQAINTGGSLVLMAGDITLSGTSIQVGESISLIATGEGCNGCSTGLRANGDLIISRETTITAQSGRVIAANGIVNATDLILDFNGGDFELAVSAEQQDTSQPSPLSNVRGVQLSANTSAFIRNLGLNLVSVSVSFANPAASIMGVRAIEVIDLALFEEDLTLFGRLGEGVALAFAQCEEVEGCTPDVTVEELTASINELELRIQQLEAELKSTTDPERRKELEQMLAEYRAQQEEFMAYRTDLQDFTGFEQQFEDEFGAIGEDDIDMEALEREVAMIETIYTRVRFLESLQFNRERREVFAERTGLDLSDERLSQIIESTLKAASRSEARIEKMLDGN